MEEKAFYFKIRGLIDPVCEIHIRDGVHFKPHGMYRIYRAVQGAVCEGLNLMDRLRGGNPLSSNFGIYDFISSLTGFFCTY